MKTWFKHTLSTMVTATLALSFLVACTPKQNQPKDNPSTSSQPPAASAIPSTDAAKKTEPWEFTDSVGRKVMVPAEIKSIAPSGPLAQLVLYTAYPDYLAGVSKAFGKKQAKYFPEKYTKLPEFGQFYGSKGSLNKEELLAA